MRKVFLITVLVLISSNLFSQQNARNGYTYSPTGEIRLFVVFADIVDDTISGDILPKEVKVSEIHFMDLTGSLIVSYQVYDRGEGKLVLKGETLKPGMYLYSLVTDNEIIETKKLMLTK
jgi:hypothetical protein